MPSIQYKRLDTTDPHQVAQYERALYRAFNTRENRALGRIWAFDDETRRVRKTMPYESQEVYAAWMDDAVVSGVTIIRDKSVQWQIEMLGHSFDKAEEGICEGLSLFNSPVSSDSIKIVLGLGAHVFHTLTDQGITKCYGCCADKLVRGYQLIGFKKLTDRVVNGERSHLLVIEMKDAATSRVMGPPSPV